MYILLISMDNTQAAHADQQRRCFGQQPVYICLLSYSVVCSAPKWRYQGGGAGRICSGSAARRQPLWTLPNVYMTPHSTARTTRFMHDNVDLFLENLQRCITGQELLTVVDKALGY
jgi:hypothetical protein